MQHAELFSQLLIFFYHRMNEVVLRKELSGCLSPPEVTSNGTIQGGVHIFEFRESLAHPVDHAFHGLLVHQEGASLNWVKGKGIVHLVLLTVEVSRTQDCEDEVLLVVRYFRLLLLQRRLMIVSLSLEKLQIFVAQKVYKICLLVSGRHESIFSLEHVLAGERLLDCLTYQGQELSKGLLSPCLPSDLFDV